MTSATPHRIVIVGGGAGGLELATMLGDRDRRRRRFDITLVDCNRTHVWKPKLHEIAAGSMDSNVHEVGYLAHARNHGFRFRLGRVDGLDRAARQVQVAEYVDDDGLPVMPRRQVLYDTLLFAVGSQSNDFGTPGVAEHAMKLESQADAERFHTRLINACIRAQAQTAPLSAEQLHIAIIGAGATGVELAAELHFAVQKLVGYGFDRLDAGRDIQISVIEAAERVLPALAPKVSTATQILLEKLRVQVHTGARVAAVQSGGVRLADGRILPAELVVWAAGVKAPAFLHELDGLETNRINQLVVRPTLQTTRDDAVFAIGDCAACIWPQAQKAAGASVLVPPRAQAAHQQATHLTRQLVRRLERQPLQEWTYRDFGSLVSLGEHSTVGSLMNAVTGNDTVLQGFVPRLMYLSLYKLHELALHGWPKVALDTLARTIVRRTEPHIKLH